MKNVGQIIKSKLTERFVTLSNDLARSENLTMEEVGLMAYILSLPSDWVIYKKNLYEGRPIDTKGAIDRVFKSLQDKGYILSVRVINPKGQFIGWNHVIYDFPSTNGILPTPTMTDVGQNDTKPISIMTDVGQNAPIQKKEDITLDNTKTEEIQNSGSKEPAIDSLHIKIKKEFMDFYEKHKGTSYYWKAIDGKKTNSIINQISFKIKENVALKESPQDVMDSLVLKSFSIMLATIKAAQDGWYLTHLDMNMIDSKFNTIVAMNKIKPVIKKKEEIGFTGPVPANV